jgi:hypothetical protein
MQYKVKLEATVEAESAESAKQIVLGKPNEFAGPVQIEAVPTKEWTVYVEITATCAFAVKVNAESAEDAKCKAYELVDDEARYGHGITGVLELADNDDYELADLDIAVYDAEPVEDEEDDEPAQPATATAVDDDADSAAPDTATAA